MRRSREEIIAATIAEGYVLLEEGKGSQDEALKKYRAQGYDVRAWYDHLGKIEDRSYVMYGKVKGQRRSKAPAQKIDYSKMTVKDLKKYCKEHKVPGYSKMSKSELISALSL